LSRLAAEARERRNRIKEIISNINGSADEHSNPADPANLLPRAVDGLSDPTLKHTLVFPFVGFRPQNRFKMGKGLWPYMGRTKFKDLVQELNDVRQSPVYTTVWLYGTQGYGKSHLLAALVCYLAARDERVVYIPDCRAYLLAPIRYVQAAMLFAWADDIITQREIMTLNTEAEIEAFLRSQDSVLFVIDQMNALKKSDNQREEVKRARLEGWIGRYTSRHKAVFSTSGNDTGYLQKSIRRNSNRVLAVYGGFTRVSHLIFYVAMRLLTRLGGNGPVVGA